MSIFDGTAKDIQFKLKAGNGIVISGEHDEVISSSGGSGIPQYDELPASAEYGTLAYLNGVGFYRFTTEWVRITSDSLESDVTELETDVASLDQDSHTHSNKAVLDTVTSNVVSNSHTHSNKLLLDNITFENDELYYNGRPIGVPVVTELPSYLDNAGRIYYLASENAYLSGLHTPGGSGWLQLTRDDAVSKVHSHLNKTALDLITSGKLEGYDDAVTKKHTHSNKDVLDTVTSAVVSNSHTHSNKSTLDKFGESSGSPTFDGDPIGGGVDTYSTPSALPNNADNGSVAVALTDDPSNSIVYPSQTAGEEVSVDIADKSIMFGNPTFNGTAIDAAITAQDISAEGSVSIVTGQSSTGNIPFSITPVVSDEDTNEYTAAGITIEDPLVVPSFTKKYAISAMFGGIKMIKPDKIVPVDAEHVKIPGIGIYAFENLSGATFDGVFEDADLSAGWNLVLATVDTETYSVPSSFELVNGAVDLNDYFTLTNHDENTFTIEGVSGSAIFTDTIVGVAGKEKGLYVRLANEWSRCTFDTDQDFEDVVPLAFTTYQTLVVRDEVSDDSIQDVPVYYSGSGEIVRLEADNDDYIALAEDTQDDGTPIRFIKTVFSNVEKDYYPVDKVSSGSVSIPKGWSTGGTSTSAPSFSGFTPSKVVYNGHDYTGSFSYEVQAALNSLSQCINVSKAAMGHINIPDDAVVRFNGKIEPNRKYFFATSDDLTITLPSVQWTKKDAQFVLYLNCGDDIDITLPSDILVTGSINSEEGNHKIIGSWDKTVGKWCIGSIDYEVAE